MAPSVLRVLTFISAGVLIATLRGNTLAAQAPQEPHTGTRLQGVRVGPHGVGFRLRSGSDPSRRINQTDAGTHIGVATWYPAQTGADAGSMTFLDYRLLEFSHPLPDVERQRFIDGEVEAALNWRHVGIVALTRPQAVASFSTRGIAVRDAPPSPGTFPVIVLLGGQYYLSTTAEVLASHGFIVIAPFRFSDQPNEIGTEKFTWSLENSVRDAEWALEDARTLPQADVSRVGAIGHGGGGLQALLLAMRSTRVAALVNIDAGNFSNRTRPSDAAFYSPRLLRAPYLYVATPATRSTQDLFEDFAAMKFSNRFEVVLQDPAVRHHDLSDIGRAVTAPLGIRGDTQTQVQATYVDVQDMVVRFMIANAASRPRRSNDFSGWLRERAGAAHYTVTVHDGIVPAPTAAAVLESLGPETPTLLMQARLRDAEAPLFQEGSLTRIIGKAIAAGQPAIAEAVARLASELYPASTIVQDYKSEALEARGDAASAAETAAACAAAPSSGDWRVTVAISRCQARVSRLRAGK